VEYCSPLITSEWAATAIVGRSLIVLRAKTLVMLTVPMWRGKRWVFKSQELPLPPEAEREADT
jgi:hypothetical protein